MQEQTTVSGICGEKLKWTLDDAGTLTISGTGKMYDFDFRDPYRKFFIGNDRIRQAVILSGVESIGENAFDGCTNLRSIHIPRSVMSIQTHFYGCTDMTEIIVDADHPAYTSIDGVLYSKDGKTLLRCPCGREGIFNVPDGVTCIQSWAFGRCIRLTAVTFPDSVVHFGDFAFVGCERLTSLTVPNSVTNIAEFAFAHCTSLTAVTLPRSLTSIVKWVFDGCSSLRSVTVPDGVRDIGEWAFRECTSLSSIIIPDSVQSIGCEAFRDCTSLRSVILPNSLKRLGQSIFQNCEQLTICGISGSSAETYAVRYNIPFREVILPVQEPPCASASGVCGANVTWSLDADGTLTIRGAGKMYEFETGGVGKSPFAHISAVKKVIIESGVESIGKQAFSCCSLTSVTIPDTVTEIGLYAFEYCTKLTAVTIPHSVKIIAQDAFFACSGLTSVTMQDGVQKIGIFAFSSCVNLTSAVIPTSVTDFNALAFHGCEKLTVCCNAGSYAERVVKCYGLPYKIANKK